MRSSSLLLFSFLIVPLAVATASAAGFAETRFFAGSRELSIFSMDAAVATASGTVYGAGAQTVSERRLSRQVPGFRANLSHTFGESNWGVRGYYYPVTGGSSAEGGTLFFQTRTGDSGGDYEGNWGLSGSFVQHKLRNEPLAPPKRDKEFGEGVIEWNNRQSYFGSFNFQLTGTYFMYDRELGRVQDFKTTFQQSDVATLGTFASVTAPPEWAAAVQFSRVFDADDDGSTVFGYSRVGFKTGGQHLNSYLIGMQERFGDNIGGRLGWNLVKGKGYTQSQYWGLTVSYYWR